LRENLKNPEAQAVPVHNILNLASFLLSFFLYSASVL
jgi:hypothetical protein